MTRYTGYVLGAWLYPLGLWLSGGDIASSVSFAAGVSLVSVIEILRA